MTSIADLPQSDLARRLTRGELCIACGPFTCAFQSTLPAVLRHVQNVYANSRVCPSSEFIDFRVGVHHARWLRRFVRPITVFSFDGATPFNPLPAEQAAAQLEWGLNWCVASHSHRYLILHAAVVERHGRALILPGEPGSGKSTLCAALTFAGWRLLSDEMALIDLDDLAISPVPRPLSLKNVSIDIIRERAPEAVFGEIVKDTAKGNLAHIRPPDSAIAGEYQRVSQYDIVYPRYTAGSATSFRELPRADSCLRLIENAFNFTLLGERGFTAATRVTDRARHRRLEYSSLDEAMALLEEHVAAS